MSGQLIIERTTRLLERLNEIFLNVDNSITYKNIIKSTIQSLSEPCRLAITGRVKSGKSSLINVLLGGDYAKVGVSETTATINIFKFGKPDNIEKPILCEYISGDKKWLSRANLDSLQGTSQDVIERISQIKTLTYFLEDERLKNVTLIDTPGIDAVVGDDGDAHQQQTETFLGLRRQHKEQTIELSNNADAVILLLGDVAHESDKDFIDGFLRNRGTQSSVNTIGILSQIDLTDERISNRVSIAQERYETLSSYVNCVIPISAGIKRYLPTFDEAVKIRESLLNVPSKQLLDYILSGGPQRYFKQSIPGIELTLDERQKLYWHKDMPFRCFAVIAKKLYECESNDAIKELNEISGIDNLKLVLDQHFFKRSHHIKAEIAIKQALHVIWDFMNCSIDQYSNSNNHLERLSHSIQEIQRELEILYQESGEENRYFQALLLLIENESLFSKAEKEELSKLFGNGNVPFDNQRLKYWFGQSNTNINETRRELAHLAYNKYTDIAFQ